MKSYSTLGTKVPDDLSKVAEVVADIKSKMNGDDGQIQSFGKAVLDVSRLIGGDSSKLMGSAIDILKTWGGTASDGAGLMDKLLIASQRSTVGFADLGAQINEQGAVLRGMGFNFDESLSMLAQWGKEGKSAKDTVDMMNKAFTALSKQEGVTDPVQSFKDMITLIQNAKTEQGALNLAMAGFGEAGKGMAEAIRSSTFVPDPNILGAIQTSTGAVVQQTQETMTLGERWGIVGNQILIALAPLGQALLYLAETVVPFVGGAVGFLARNADILAPALAGVAAVILWALAPSLWALVPSLLASAAGAWAIVAPFLPIIGLALLVGAAIGGLAYLFREHFGKIRNTVMGVVSAVQEFFGLVDSKKDLSLNTSLNHDTAMPAGFPKELMAAPSSVLPPLPNPTAAQPLFSAPAMQMPGPLVKPADVKPDPVLPSGVAAKLGSAASPSAAVLNAIPAGAGSQTGAYANQVYQGAAAASAGKKPAAGTGDIQITVTGNEFHVRKESDIDEIARALAKQIRAAGGLMA
nr:phage tail tape measure protein [Ectobacillus ponti]